MSSRRLIVAASACGVAASLVLVPGTNALASSANNPHGILQPGHLVLSHTRYTVPANAITPGVTVLPGCVLNAKPADPNCTAVADAGYPEVFNNEAFDGSFGITTPIYLDTITPSGNTTGTLPVPTDTNGDHLVTSFPSKSELALNLSTAGDALTFMGYVAPVGALDVSNSNTPGVVDPTNPVHNNDYRAIGEIKPDGSMSFTETNAYSGNNGRAAILADSNGLNEFFMSGNAGNGGKPQPGGVVAGAGAQMTTPSTLSEAQQTAAGVGLPTPAGSFSITELPIYTTPDKIGKDTNFRGLTIHNNVVYLTKGSGGNGIDTVYYIDTTGSCHDGQGIPDANAPLPASPLAYNINTVNKTGVQPFNICVLKGFPTVLAGNTTNYPFGLWFANDTTLYVADEGDGTPTYDPATNTYTDAAGQTNAGLEKWVLANGTWSLAYTIQDGLNLGTPYSVTGYPTGDNAATGLPWAPATDGLRNITGEVNGDGTVTIWGITSTVSGATDEGADPNRLVRVTDPLAATSPAGDTFKTLRTATSGEALRGILYVPGS
jgi:hypothetical protein